MRCDEGECEVRLALERLGVWLVRICSPKRGFSPSQETRPRIPETLTLQHSYPFHEVALRDELSPEEFAPVEQALKRLPYFDPSTGFADRVMARVTRFQAVAAPGSIQPVHRTPMPELVPEREDVVHYMRRPLPVRLVATALLASAAVTMSLIALMAVFRPDLFMLVVGAFGNQTLGFLAILTNEAGAAILGDTGLGYVQSAGSLAGIATMATFAAGALGATAVLRAAASSNRKAA